MKERTPKSWDPLVWLCALSLAMPAALHAQQTETPTTSAKSARVPARPLPAEMSGILLREERIELEHPDEIVERLGLQDGDLVADVGCGPGYYSLRLAERIAPHGAVFAVDIQQAMLDQLAQRMSEAGVRNVYPVLGGENDPRLPPGKMDWVLLVDAYHEFSNPEAMLSGIRDSLAPGGRVALLEYRAEQDPATINLPIPRDHKMTIDEVMSEWTAAGFELVELLEFLPAQHYFIFEKAGEEGDASRPWHERSQISKLELGSVRNLSTLGGYIYFAGQPGAEDFRLFADRGVKTVINLRAPSELEALGFDEKERVEQAGMTYVNVPMGSTAPGEEDLKKILDILDHAGDERVLLHCGSSNRVGAIWSLHRGLKHGYEADEAIAEGQSAGMRAPALEKMAREALEAKAD